MNQTGPEFLRTCPSNAGEIEFIVTERVNRPKGLRKPYEYIVPLKHVQEKYKALHAFLKTQSEDIFQHAYCDKKSISKGIRFNVFLLGYPVRYTIDESGCSKKEWETLTAKTQEMVYDLLGPDAKMYIEPFNKNSKFQARFEAYIAYEEMI